jgi:ADP-ribosylglycohydrolase
MKQKLSYDEYRDRVLAAWLGKSIGGVLGARLENHKARMALEPADLWPEKIVANDDLDIQLVWLEALQERGVWIGSADLAEFWQERCWYNFCEYGVFLNNWQRGIRPPLSGTWNNRFFMESEGCPIRSEIWGLVCPGNPALAAAYAARDGQLDHGGAAVHCESFLAAAAAAAFFDNDIGRVLDIALQVLPPESAVPGMVAETRAICAAHPRFPDAWHLLVRRFGDRDASKALMNQAIVVMALILGEGDFVRTMQLACNSGWDTDCTAATAGALLAVMHGREILPADWLGRLGERLACGIRIRHDQATFTDLAEETARVGVEMALQRNPAVEISGAPPVTCRPAPAPEVELAVRYPEGPFLRADRSTTVLLEFRNRTDTVQEGEWRLEPRRAMECRQANGRLRLAPGTTATVETALSPISGPVWDKNLLTLEWRPMAGAPRIFGFGLGGARLWRVYGPYWDIWDTAQEPICPWHGEREFKFPPAGASWNHFACLDREYLDETELLQADLPGELPALLQVGEDYLTGQDLAGFRGQACFYLVRELVAETPVEIMLNVTGNAPMAVWYAGREVLRRETPRLVSPQDGGIGPLPVGPEPRRLVIKLARQADDLEFCLVPVVPGKPDPQRGISMFADCLGDVPPAG